MAQQLMKVDKKICETEFSIANCRDCNWSLIGENCNLKMFCMVFHLSLFNLLLIQFVSDRLHKQSNMSWVMRRPVGFIQKYLHLPLSSL